MADGFVRYYGSEAEDPSRTEVLASGNAVVALRFARLAETFLGVGRSSRPGGITERYYALSPAPGGFQVGNPAIAAETKNEVEAGLVMKHRVARVKASVYYNAFEDYILPTTLAQQDVNGDGVVDRVKGFKNVDAALAGADVSASVWIHENVTVPLGVGLMRGHNTTDDRPLPEIPPWEGRLAVRVAHGTRTHVWGQLGARVVGAQDRVDEAFGEDETDGFFVMHVRVGARIAAWGLQLESGVENLLNRDYHEHLTREALLAVGGLRAGDEIPAPGRSVYLGAKWLY